MRHEDWIGRIREIRKSSESPAAQSKACQQLAIELQGSLDDRAWQVRESLGMALIAAEDAGEGARVESLFGALLRQAREEAQQWADCMVSTCSEQSRRLIEAGAIVEAKTALAEALRWAAMVPGPNGLLEGALRAHREHASRQVDTEQSQDGEDHGQEQCDDG